MKNKTKRIFSIITAGVMSAYLIINGLFIGEGIPALLILCLGIGMLAAFVALITKRTDGKIYNTAMVLGGLPSLAFIAFPIWTMFQGAFKPEGLISLIIGVICVLIISKVSSTDNEADTSIKESAVEANE